MREAESHNEERRTTALRKLITSPDLSFLMEAHNGLSARIVEEAGFQGIWASGLTISAQHGVRDNNELSWTQVVDTLEFMSDAAGIPILLDGDTGYGDFNNMRRLVHKLEQRGIGGVCIEDKLFPKTNSFIEGDRQPLAEVEEFCGKVKAGKDSQEDPDFCIVARVEALIAGWGIDEALRRAEAYHEAGADAILIHSRRAQPDEILAFAVEWNSRGPLVIVPTKYYSTPTEVFRAAGINVVIWANHLLRASMRAMQEVAGRVREEESLIEIEGRVGTVEEIFRLQGADELLEAEKRYAPGGGSAMRAVVLAASRGEGLEDLTEERPKVMIPVAGKPLLRRLIDKFKAAGVRQIDVVGGYRAETLEGLGATVIHNPDFEKGGELVSLACAGEVLRENTVVLYGDLLFRSYIIADLLGRSGEIVAVVDSAPVDLSGGEGGDLAYCSAPDNRGLYRQEVFLEQVTREADWKGRVPSGRWIGMLRVCDEGREWVAREMEALQAGSEFRELGVPDLLNALVARGREVRVMYIHGHWLDLNNVRDLQLANDFAHYHVYRDQS